MLINTNENTTNILLWEDMWLRFERIDNEESKILAYLCDNTLYEQTLLGVSEAGKWVFTTPARSQLFWQLCKSHPLAAKRALRQLIVPTHSILPYRLEWSCFKRRFVLQTIKMQRKIMHITK